MATVLCIGGLDPSGNAGLSIDIRVLEGMGMRALPVAACLTVQTSGAMYDVHPVPAELVAGQVKVLLAEEGPDAVKLGMLAFPDTVNILARMLGTVDIPVVADPVLGSSTGFTLDGPELAYAYVRELFPVSSLVTPNIPEAETLAGMSITGIDGAAEAAARLLDSGPGAVLLKGGHMEGARGTDILCQRSGITVMEPVRAWQEDMEPRGTGCALASLIAGFLAAGRDIDNAVADARELLPAILGRQAGTGGAGEELNPEGEQCRRELGGAVSQVLGLLPASMVPEVGCNMAFAEPGAVREGDVWSLDSRMVAKGQRVVCLGEPVRGRDSHVARVVLAAMGHDPDVRCALNLRYSRELVELLEEANFTLGTFDRQDEPDNASSVEWGTEKAIRELGYVPDAVYDLGGPGKEPMIRLLASDPRELLDKLKRMLVMVQ